ncbi:hypothetical protein INR49_020411, partial [Caranx melampygus]
MIPPPERLHPLARAKGKLASLSLSALQQWERKQKVQTDKKTQNTEEKTGTMMELTIQLIPTGEIILSPGKNGENYCHGCK